MLICVCVCVCLNVNKRNRYCVCVAIFVDEDDIAAYTIRTINDPRTCNKTVYIRPSENILSQREVVELWEKLIGKQVEKSSLSEQDFLNIMRGDTLT